jgi:hypothetical protein
VSNYIPDPPDAHELALDALEPPDPDLPREGFLFDALNAALNRRAQ